MCVRWRGFVRTEGLSSKKRVRGYNPFLEADAKPFLEGSRYIRTLAFSKAEFVLQV